MDKIPNRIFRIAYSGSGPIPVHHFYTQRKGKTEERKPVLGQEDMPIVIQDEPLQIPTKNHNVFYNQTHVSFQKKQLYWLVYDANFLIHLLDSFKRKPINYSSCRVFQPVRDLWRK